jgi:hypothetical protein
MRVGVMQHSVSSLAQLIKRKSGAQRHAKNTRRFFPFPPLMLVIIEVSP